MIDLQPDETLSDRPFTDLRHSATDLVILRYLVTSIRMTIEAPDLYADQPRPVILYQPSARHWTNRRVLTQPERLAAATSLTVVGFFGQRSPGANLKRAQRLDHELVAELGAFEDLFCYASLLLPTGNFANLVLFASMAAKDAFGESPRHAYAVRLLTPDFYHSVRLYNGELPKGLADPDALRLLVVKYYDYRSRPLWRARRSFPQGVPEWKTA